MRAGSTSRRPLGIRATPQEHRLLTEAAESVSEAKPRKTPEEMMAIFRAAREEVQANLPTNRDILEEFLTERRAEAARE